MPTTSKIICLSYLLCALGHQSVSSHGNRDQEAVAVIASQAKSSRPSRDVQYIGPGQNAGHSSNYSSTPHFLRSKSSGPSRTSRRKQPRLSYEELQRSKRQSFIIRRLNSDQKPKVNADIFSDYRQFRYSDFKFTENTCQSSRLRSKNRGRGTFKKRKGRKGSKSSKKRRQKEREEARKSLKDQGQKSGQRGRGKYVRQKDIEKGFCKDDFLIRGVLTDYTEHTVTVLVLYHADLMQRRIKST